MVWRWRKGGGGGPSQTIEQAILGEVLPDIGRKIGRGGGGTVGGGNGSRASGAGGSGGSFVRSTALNAARVPQSVVKRVTLGGTRNIRELKRQMNYIIRDEANVASWANQIGIDRSFGEDKVDRVAGNWSSAWVGAPKRGHTDHIILSFPKGTDAALAEAISRDWGQEVFGRQYRDRYRYVAALHHNTEHVHTHFIVDKVGMDHGKFLSISQHAKISYDMMRELHCHIAAEHGLDQNASTRLSRGIVENPPRQVEIQAARLEGRDPVVVPLSDEERDKRLAAIQAHREHYAVIGHLAQMTKDPDAWTQRIAEGAEKAVLQIQKEEPIMDRFDRVETLPDGAQDPAARLLAAREQLVEEASRTWASIMEMESGPEKVSMELAFADKTQEIQRLVGRDVMEDHAPIPREEDPYAVGLMDVVAARAADPDDPLRAAADRHLLDVRDQLDQAFAPYASRFEENGMHLEEIVERFISPERTRAQLDASAPEDPVDRAAWEALERDLQGVAQEVYDSTPMDRDLLVDMARTEMRDASAMDRLADIRALDQLVMEVRAAHETGEALPLSDDISDPTVRAAVWSEIKTLEDLTEDADPTGRDSELVRDYQRMIQDEGHVQERARIRERDTGHDTGRDSIDDDSGWSL